MPEFIDHMTGECIIKPAMDPCGHVLGYDSWMKILGGYNGPKNTCPFSRIKVTRRQLIKLTKDNYDDHKDKITEIGAKVDETEQQSDDSKKSASSNAKSKSKAKSKTKGKSKSTSKKGGNKEETEENDNDIEMKEAAKGGKNKRKSKSKK